MSDRPAARVRSHIASAPWMLTPEMLQTLVHIADRDNLSPQAVAADLGRPLDNTHSVAVRDGVAIIPVDGVITRYMSVFAAISGGVSIETLATDLHAALDNPAISSILLDVDSPGGEANGVGEFAAMVRAANERKPVVAYVGGLAASAGYYLASAAGEVVIAADAILGNIGVIMGVPDPAARPGRTIDFISSQSPHKRLDPRTEGGKSRLQATVDALADVFVGAVATYRGLTPDAVIALGGDVLIGQAAIDAGLADRLGSFEGVVAELQQRAREPRRMSGGAGRVAARNTGGVVTEQHGRMERFMAWLGGAGDDAPFAQANSTASGGAVGVPIVAGRSDVSDTTNDELLQARAEIAALRQAERARAEATVATDAAAFAETEIAANRAIPAEREALVTAYSEAAQDDAAHPRDAAQASRVVGLAARQAARPTHNLTAELLPLRQGEDGALTVVGSERHTRQEGDAEPFTAERWREQRAFTPTGRGILARHGIPVAGALSAEHRATIATLVAQQGLTLAV